MNQESAMKKSELIVVVVILSILASIGIPSYLNWLNKSKLSIAITSLAQWMRYTRYESIGDTNPKTICINDNDQQLKVAVIPETDCESVTNWRDLPSGVIIDRLNSSLRTQPGVAGNNGTIYRASWADTAAGIGGSWGQLGRITLMSNNSTERKCIFLSHVDGRFDVRNGDRCIR